MQYLIRLFNAGKKYRMMTIALKDFYLRPTRIVRELQNRYWKNSPYEVMKKLIISNVKFAQLHASSGTR